MYRSKVFTVDQLNKMVELYTDGDGSTVIARKLGDFTHSQVLHALNKMGVEMRSFGRGRPQASIPMDNRIIALINGSLLGDATLFPTNSVHINSGLTMVQSENHKGLLFWFKDRLEEAGLTASIRMYKPSLDVNRQDAYNLYTQRTKEFTPMRARWYSNGKKVVPNNITLSPEALSIWYMSDGTKHPNGGLTIYTNGLTFRECEFLRGILWGSFGIISSVAEHKPGENSWAIDKNKSVPTLYIAKREAVKFFNITGECPVSCFEYKWP